MVEIKDKFSVVVPVLNSKSHLRGCLNSILAAMERYGTAELIVLDNGSDDGSYEILSNEYAGRARVRQIRGVTVSELRNRGADLADGEFIAFIDSDCLIGPDYFEQALPILRNLADVTGSQYALENGCHWIQKTWHMLHVPPRDGIVNYIVAGNLVIKRRAFFSVGGFDKRMVSCEDNDLGLRLNKAGFKVYQSQAVRALHPGGEQNLRVFFRKTAWRSMGMFRMMKHSWMNKPLVITFAHLVFCLAAIANLFGSHASLLARVLVSLLLVNLAPVLTVLFYSLRVKRFYAPLRSVLLYHLWFLARFYAMAMMVGSLGASTERKIAIGGRLHSPPQSRNSTLSQ
jgi:glycosyltransferase involved in cell wall biosynthesis